MKAFLGLKSRVDRDKNPRHQTTYKEEKSNKHQDTNNKTKGNVNQQQAIPKTISLVTYMTWIRKGIVILSRLV